jgi:MFS family permease
MSTTSANDGRAALMRDPSYRWMIAGGAISMLGDQFTLLAMPWLVLNLTGGDTFMLGVVIALASIPRALFILVGGALVDRYSPKRVLMLTKHVNTALLTLLAALVMTNALTLPMLCVLSLAIGLSSAFSIPSATSMTPQVVPREHLAAANGMMMVLRQFSMFAGPLLAGTLIALAGNAAAGGLRDALGLGLVFLFDAFSFAVSAWTLSKVQILPSMAAMQGASTQNVLHSVAEGLRYCWNDHSLRTCFTYWAAVAFFVSGPIMVAIPVLATQLSHGALSLGLLVGANGFGTLIGALALNINPKLRIGRVGLAMLTIDGVIGALFMPLGLINATWQGVALLFVIGTLGGFLQVTVFTWLMRHTAPPMMGRTMAMFMFIFMGVAPMSAALTGWLMRYVTLTQIFAGAGAMLVTSVLIAFATSRIRTISDLRPAGAG